MAEQTPLGFINFGDNSIDYRPTAMLSERFAVLVQQAALGEQPLRVLHIGDSHIQADFFTGETRRLLSVWLGDDKTSRGFTFPYPIVGSNNPDDYLVAWKGEWTRNRNGNSRLSSPLGVAGISISTQDTNSQLTVSLNPKGQSIKPFDLVRIYYDCRGDSITPVLSSNSKMIEQADGFIVYQLPAPTDSVSISLIWNDPEADCTFTLYGMELLNSQAKLVYHAAGVNGASVKSMLQSENFAHQARLLNPQVVIVSFGTNDAYNEAFRAVDFAKDLRELIARIQDNLPQSIVILTTPGDHLLGNKETNPKLELIQSEIYAVARDMDCGVWDFYRVMGGEGSIEHWKELDLCAPDMLHLNRKGYRLQGSLLFDALVKLSGYEQQELTNKLFANE